jgi:O-antigen/teichoic acid export membrane protein
MTTEGHHSYRQILKSTLVSGGATFGVILINLLKMKVFALLLGPVGIGLYGILNAILGTAAMLAGMGVANSAVRQIGAAAAAPADAVRVRWAVWAISWPLALLAAAALWLLREPIAAWVLDDAGGQSLVAWMGIGAALTVLAGSQLGVLQGHRQVADVARVRLYGNLLAAVVGIACVATFYEKGLVPALLAVPLAGLIVGLRYSHKLPQLSRGGFGRAETMREWRPLVALGLVLMATGFFGSLVQILLRVILVQDLGLEAAGLFQASWAIASMSVSLVLTAMAADFYPRLSALSDDAAASRELINQQIYIALLLGGPMLAGLIALSPLLLHLAYSSEFLGAAELMRWQLAGEMLKLPCWALGFILVTRSDYRFILPVEATLAGAHVAIAWLLVPWTGLEAAGMGYLLAFLIYAPLLLVIAWRRHAITISRQNARLLAAQFPLLVGVVWLSRHWQEAAVAAGLLLALVFALHSAWRLQQASLLLPAGLAGRFGKLLGWWRR